jgi:hypothetical protein
LRSEPVYDAVERGEISVDVIPRGIRVATSLLGDTPHDQPFEEKTLALTSARRIRN